MESEHKLSVIVVGLVAIAVINIAWAISFYYTQTTRYAMEHGYIMQSIPGNSTPQWTKAPQGLEKKD